MRCWRKMDRWNAHLRWVISLISLFYAVRDTGEGGGRLRSVNKRTASQKRETERWPDQPHPAGSSMLLITCTGARQRQATASESVWLRVTELTDFPFAAVALIKGGGHFAILDASNLNFEMKFLPADSAHLTLFLVQNLCNLKHRLIFYEFLSERPKLVEIFRLQRGSNGSLRSTVIHMQVVDVGHSRFVQLHLPLTNRWENVE